MKNILLIVALLGLAIIISCGENENYTSPKQELPTNNTIPEELIGDWKINYVTLANDPQDNWGNSFGAYIKFNSDNSIEYKDGNKFAGVKTVNKVKDIKQVTGKLSDLLSIDINSVPTSITCSYSGKHPGQVEFRITYQSNAGFDNMILVGTKQ